MESIRKINTTKCFHCGDVCKSVSTEDNKTFCCEGCKTVYLLLKENNLCTYYDLDASPGITIKARSQERFEWLDTPELTNSLFDFQSANLYRITLHIPAIHCSACIWLLENLYRMHPGILASRVNFVKQQISLAFHPEKISLRKITEILDSLGYTPELTLRETQGSAPSVIDRTLLYKIGIAGFCSGNIMLLSFPEYFGLSGLQDEDFRKLFSFLNLALALPVVVYSSSDYFSSAWKGFKNKLINLDVPISLGIAAVFLRSVYEVLSGTGPGYFDSLTGLIFFLLIGRWYQRKTYQRFSFERDYQSYFPVAVLKTENDKETQTSIKDLKPGDSIIIRNQEVIPVDSYLVSGEAWIDYSFVSGENIPVKKESGDLIYAGGKQTNGRIKLVVKEKFAQNYFLQLWNKEVFSKPKNAYLSSFVLTFSKYFTIATLILAISTFVFWYVADPSRSLFALTSVLLVACPCALALSLPFALSNGLRRLAKSGFYAKDADTLEMLSEADTIVFDKTGTLTSADQLDIRYHGEELYRSDLIYLRSAFQQSSHPLSRMLYEHLQAETLTVEDFEEFPSKGFSCTIGAHHLRIGSPEFIEAGIPENANGTCIFVELNGHVKGYFEIRNQYRKSMPELLEALGEHYHLHLISGDNNHEQHYLQQFFKADNLLFNLKPDDKYQYVELLKKKGNKVLMIGDGLNDAGALKMADAGIVISDQVYNFFPASDGMLEGNKLAQLNNYLAYAKRCIRVIKASLVLSVAYNMVGLFFAVTGNLSPLIAAILMPLSSVSAVLFVVAGTSWYSIEKRTS